MERNNIIVDANVVLSTVISPNSVPAAAFYHAIEGYTLLQSKQTFDELVARLNSGKIQKYSSPENRNAVLEDVKAVSQFVEVAHTTDICRDEKDNKFLELAVSGNARYIVSGDKDLLTIEKYRGTEILTPAQFLEREKPCELGRAS